MDKLKGMLKISERDKKLLLIVATALIVVLAYFFGYQNLSSQADDLSSRKSKLEVTQRDLKEKNNNKDKYLADTTKLQTENRSALSRFDSGSTQPNTINFFIKTEGVTGVWVKSLALSPTTSIYRFGQVASSNVNGGSAYSSNMSGYKSTINIAYESDYSQWKHFIDYINTYSNKTTIDALTSSYNDATGIVTGTVSISLYAVEGSDRKFTEPTFDVKTGTDNIFSENSAN